MAFSNGQIRLGSLTERGTGEGNHDALSTLMTVLSANTTTLSAVGGTTAVAEGVGALLRAWSQLTPDNQRILSANALVSVAASSTSTLLTLQLQIIPAV